MDSSDIYGGPPLQMPLTPFEFVKQPRVVLKIVVMIISVIGLGCSTNGCMVNNHSIFNKDPNACHFGVAVTVLAFLISLISVVTDYMCDKTANIKRRRCILLSDIADAGLLAFLNFVAFCYLANRWSHTNSTWLDEMNFEHWQRRNARSLIFFSFLALFAWVSRIFWLRGVLQAAVRVPILCTRCPVIKSDQIFLFYANFNRNRFARFTLIFVTCYH
ncbi:unnamed protein product [Mesocestoides corti]|uniref:MARVEL domain-containing protein n=2 Tax=Mesocestoides corti TaxID=53468 RepID=A0A0R3UR18_MESCO|nr:unnamed protein product [Mesocestoides corti]